MIGGADEEGLHLYETDPSGALVSYKAGSIGSGSNTVREVFEEKYEDGMEEDAAILLGLEALQKASEEKLKADAVEVGVVQPGKRFRMLTAQEVDAFLRRIRET